MATLVQVVTEKFNPISAAIRQVTRSPFSHVEFVKSDTGETFGSRYIGGVKWRPASDSSAYTYVERYTSSYVEQALVVAETQAGKPYDLTAIFGIALDRNWQEDDSWFCSELVGWSFIQTNGFLFQKETKLNRIFPGHIPMSLALTRVS